MHFCQTTVQVLREADGVGELPNAHAPMHVRQTTLLVLRETDGVGGLHPCMFAKPLYRHGAKPMAYRERHQGGQQSGLLTQR